MSRPAAITAAAVSAAIATLLVVQLLLCGGQLVYTLDDPYITLALGQNISHGHYGIHASENASPASSMLYPLLLALFGRTAFIVWVPLLINAAAAAGTAALLVSIYEHYRPLPEPGGRAGATGRVTLVAFVLCLALNIIGVVYTGLEHSLHVLVSMATVYGIALTLENDEAPRWLVPVTVLLPALRFEGLALALLALGALAVVGQWRKAAAGLLCIVVLMASYVAAMHALGLPPLPTSVLTRSAALQPNLPLIVRVILPVLNAAQVLRLHEPAITAWVAFLLLILHPVLRARGLIRGGQRLSIARERILVVALAGAFLAHALLGDWGFWFRYEIYVVAVLACGLIIVWHPQVTDFVERAGRLPLATVCAATLFVNFYYVRATLLDPLASRNIYEQQYQMHRLVVDYYHGDVAVNDLGYVCFDNPDYVLDLWGIASEDVRQARLVRREPGWLQALTDARHIKMVIIYSQLYAREIPQTWIKVGTLTTAHPKVTIFANNVDIYATSSAATPRILDALHGFAPTLSASVGQLTLD